MLYPDATIQSQYAASPTITALVEGFNAQIDPRSEVQLFFDKIFNPRTAEGVGLDIWARIVGVERNIYVEEMGSNFGFFITGGSPTSETYAIPSAIQSLTGYGWSAGDVCNEIDFERKVYIQRVASVDLGSISWNVYSSSGTPMRFTSSGISSTIKTYESTTYVVGNMVCPPYITIAYADRNSYDNCIFLIGTSICVIDSAKLSTMTGTEFKTAMSGVTLYYELETPIETDISSIISSAPSLSVEPNSTLTFTNSNGDDYHIPVPSTITYTAGGESVTDDTVAYTKSVGYVQGNVSIESIGGKTVVWNQLVSNDNLFTASSATVTITASGGKQYITTNSLTQNYSPNVYNYGKQGIISGHVYLFTIAFNQDVSSWYSYLRVHDRTNSKSYSVSTYYNLFTATDTSNDVAWFFGTIPTGTSLTNLEVATQIYDLTLMFGTGNEPTAEQFEAMFPADYYAYDTGTLKSAGVTGVSYTKRPVIAQEWEPWDQGVFYSPDTVQRGSYRIDDTAFRKFIFWKALANISTADCYTLNRLLSKLFDNPVIVTETGVMQIRMTTTKPLADWQKAVLVQYGMFGKPCGVGYEFWTIVTPVLGFVRDGENYMPLGQAPFFSGVMNSDFGGN